MMKWLVVSMLVGCLSIASPALGAEADAKPSNAASEEHPLLAEARLAVRKKDYEAAVGLWRKAAKQGYAEAQYRLGVAHRSGIGVARDLDEAVRWLNRAAKGGSAAAHYSLGEMFRTGLGVEPDRGRAISYLEKAASAGHAGARRRLERIGRSSSVAFASADSRIQANRMDPREALTQAIRVGDPGAAREAIARGAPLDGAPGDRKHWRPLILAIDRGASEMVALLLSSGADSNVRSRSGELALILAARHGDRSIVRALLQAGAKVDALAPSGYTALMVAAQEGHGRILRDLLDAGADAAYVLEDGTSAATVARRFGHDRLHRTLLRAGAPRGAGEDHAERLAVLRGDSARGTDEAAAATTPPVVEAARRGDLELVREMVERGVDLGVRDADGDTAMLRAAEAGHSDVVNVLLGAGVSPDQRGRDGETASMRAMQSAADGTDVVFDSLLAAGADVAARNDRGMGLIDCAAGGASASKLSRLAEMGGSWTPMAVRQALEDAAAHGRTGVVAAILPIADDPRARSGALCRAIEQQHEEIVSLIVSGGASPTGECGSGRTPLSTAIRNADQAIVDQLLAAGADPNELHRGADSPLILAAGLGRVEGVRALLARGAEVDQIGAGHMTALMAAATRGHAEVVAALLDAGASRRIRSDTDQTALDLAVQAGATEVATLIESHSRGWAAWLSGR